MQRLILFTAILLGVTCPLCGDTITGYTVVGTGGVSGPVAGFTNSSFWWADNTGSANASSLASNYGYGVFQDGGSYGVGSLLVSNPFTMDATSTLQVSFSLFTADSWTGSGFDDFGFAVLLKDSQVVSILGALRPDGINHVGDYGAFPSVAFADPGQNVSVIVGHGAGPNPVPNTTLGSQTYGTLVDGGSCGSGPNCFTDFTSSVTPGAGTYQLMFGSFNAFGTPRNASAVAVTSVQVPEPGGALQIAFTSLLMIGAGIWKLRHRGKPEERN